MRGARRERAWTWGALAVTLPLTLWLLVPGQHELDTVSAKSRAKPEAPAVESAFERALPAGLARLRALLAVAPDRADWRRTFAFALEDAGEPAEAMDQWRRLAADPQAPVADLRQAARELIGHDAQADGVAILVGLADRNRLDGDALRDAAQQAGAADRWDEAAKLLEHLAKATPDDPWPLAMLARIHERAGRPEAAVAAWRRRFALEETAPSERLAAVALLERLGKPADAFALLDGAAEDDDLTEWRERASLAWELGKPADEIAARRAIYRRAPADQPNRLALADRLGEAGDHAGAERLYGEALAMSADDPDTVAELAMRRLDGTPELAAPLLARLAAVKDPPDRALEVLARGAADPRAAGGYLDRLLKRGGGTAATWLARGDLAARAGDLRTAAGAWREALERVPADVTATPFKDVRAKATAHLAAYQRGELRGRRDSLLAGVRSWAAYYGPPPSPLPLDRLQAPDVLVLEPDQPWRPEAIRRPGQKVLAYLSLGEANQSRGYFEALSRVPDALAEPNPRWHGAVQVDPRCVAWWGLVLETIAPPVLARGFDGFFLDTLDVGPALEAAGRPGAGGAMAGLVESLRGAFPRAVLLGNGGLALLPRTAAALDGVAIESVFTDYRFDPGEYHVRAAAAATKRADDVAAKLKPTGLPLFLLEYVDPDAADAAPPVASQARARGWIPYTAPIGLDAIP